MELTDYASLELKGRGELPSIDAEVTIHDPPLLDLSDTGNGFVINGLYTLLDIGEDGGICSNLSQGSLTS